jgi:hypothetical protein
MLANFFSKSKPVNFIVLFLVFLCYYCITVFGKNLGVLGITQEIFWFIVVFSIVNFIIVKNEVTFDNSYAFLFYVLLLGFFLTKIQINSLFYANITTLLFLRKVYSLQTGKKIIHKLFDGGLWLGISFIIEPTTIVFAPLLYASIYLHHRLTPQTLTIPVLGFIPPVLLYFTYHFWYDNTGVFQELFFWSFNLKFHLYQSSSFLFTMVFIGIFTVFATFMKTPRALAVLNKFRRNWILVLLHITIAGIVFLLIPKKTGMEFLFLLFPTSVILANGLELIQKKWLADLYIILFIVGSIVAISL